MPTLSSTTWGLGYQLFSTAHSHSADPSTDLLPAFGCGSLLGGGLALSDPSRHLTVVYLPVTVPLIPALARTRSGAAPPAAQILGLVYRHLGVEPPDRLAADIPIL